MNEEERSLDIPGDEDENAGDVPGKKKLKRKKSKEERAADRRVVFWTLIVVLGITLFFWMYPKLKIIKFGLPDFGKKTPSSEETGPAIKNYVEIRL